MASRPKTGRSASRRAAPRNRKPATIDLEAKEVLDTAKKGADAVKPSQPAKKATSSTGAADNKPDIASSAGKTASKPTVAASTKSGAEKSTRKPDENPAEKPAVGGAEKVEQTSKPKRSGGFLSALLGGVVTVAGLGAIGQVENANEIPLIGALYSGAKQSQTVDASKLQSLEDKISQLSSGGSDVSAVTDRVFELEAKLNQAGESSVVAPKLLDRIAGLETALKAVQDAGASAPATSDADTQKVQSALADVVSRLDAMETSTASSQDDPSLKVLDGKLAGLEETIASLRSEIASNAEGLQTLSSQSGELKETVASVKASEKVARSVAVTALGTALENDDPLSLPVASLEALMGATPETARLGELDAQGIPTLKMLATGLDDFTASIEEEAAPSEDASLSDRFWANAQKLVSFRSTGPRDGDDPSAILSRVKAGVENGKLADAKVEWAKLPADLQEKGTDWTNQLEMRIEALGLYQAITDQLAGAAG